MANKSISDVIASRDLIFRQSDGVESPAFIRIGRPFEKEPECWECEVHISNGVDEETCSIFGADSLQALNLTLGFLTTQLTVLNCQWKGQFQYDGMPPFELGRI
jgi:hypothetical protein